MHPDRPFEGLKIVELANILAGPSVGMFFAELGATVIKVENKATAGDITRGWKLPSEPQERDYSAYYCSINWGKRVEMLDLAAAPDRTRLYALVAEADVVLTNFKASSAVRMGVSHAELLACNPRLIIGQLDAFPDSERPAFDIVLQAETGFLYMNGAPGEPPVKMPVALIDVLAAHQLKEGILVALWRQARMGASGQVVRASLYDAAIASLVNQATNWLMAGHVPQPMGAQHPNIAPYGDLFTTQDGWLLVLAVGTERQFVALCEVVGLPELATDARFGENTARVAHRGALVAALQEAFAECSGAQLYGALLAAGVPVGRVKDLEAVFAEESAQRLILTERGSDGAMTQRVRSAVFEVRDEKPS